jgi:hypothetical protein
MTDVRNGQSPAAWCRLSPGSSLPKRKVLLYRVGHRRACNLSIASAGTGPYSNVADTENAAGARRRGCIMAIAPRRFPPPWTVIVSANGIEIANVAYREGGAGLTREEAHDIARGIARLPELLRQRAMVRPPAERHYDGNADDPDTTDHSRRSTACVVSVKDGPLFDYRDGWLQ